MRFETDSHIFDGLRNHKGLQMRVSAKKGLQEFRWRPQTHGCQGGQGNLYLQAVLDHAIRNDTNDNLQNHLADLAAAQCLLDMKHSS